MNYEEIRQRAKTAQSQMTALQEKVHTFEVMGISGGGFVTITLSGKGGVKKIDIDDSLLALAEKEVLEELLVTAFGDARQKMEKLTLEEMAKMRSELQLPPEWNLLRA